MLALRAPRVPSAASEPGFAWAAGVRVLGTSIWCDAARARGLSFLSAPEVSVGRGRADRVVTTELGAALRRVLGLVCEEPLLPRSGHPFALGRAIRFGLAFGVIGFLAKAAQVYFGETGLYLAGALAGLTDVDAISLTMANLARDDAGSAVAAARTVAIATLSNTAVKGGMAMFLGSAELRRAMAAPVATTLAAGALAVALLL